MGLDQEDYLRDLPTTTCAACGESCVGVAGVVKLGEVDVDQDTRTVMHGACYRRLLGTFEEFKRQQGIFCAECRQPCDGSEQVVELLLGRAMHMTCYENWLRRQEDEPETNGADHRRTKPAARVPGEQDMSPAQVRRQRYQQLFGPNVSRQVLEPRSVRKRKQR